MSVCAVLSDSNGKVLAHAGGGSLGEAFRNGWTKLITLMSVANPPEVTIALTTEIHAKLEFGDMSFVATHTTRSATSRKCLCGVCGWDEAKELTTFLAVSDPFGFRLLEPDLRSLVDTDPTVFYAPHPQVAVECGMCEALREKGIDPITLQPKSSSLPSSPTATTSRRWRSAAS
jgi:hypothetical protein